MARQCSLFLSLHSCLYPGGRKKMTVTLEFQGAYTCTFIHTMLHYRGYCGVSLSECTCRTWSSCMHKTAIGMWLSIAQPLHTKITRTTHTIMDQAMHGSQTVATMQEFSWQAEAVTYTHCMLIQHTMCSAGDGFIQGQLRHSQMPCLVIECIQFMLLPFL